MPILRRVLLVPALLSAAVISAGWLDLGPRLPSVMPSPSHDAAAAGPPPHTDLYGDPLPPGVVARLGTSRFRRSNRYGAVAISPDGKMLAALGDEAEVSLWDAASGKQIYHEPFPERGRGGDPRSIQPHAVLAFSPDGNTLLLGWDWVGSSRPLCLWDVAARKERLRMDGAADGFFSAVIPADFRTLAVADADGRVGLWDVASGKPRAGWAAPEVKAELVALSADGAAVAAAGEDRIVRVWDAPSGRQIHAFPAREAPVAALAFSPDGRTLAAEDRAESVVFYDVTQGAVSRRWDVSSWRVHTSLDYENSPFYLLAFSPDGRTLVLWDRDCTLNLWDVASGERRRALPGDPIRYCCFSADGKTLAGAGNGFLGLWDAASGAPLYPAHDFAVSQVRFSPDGREVVTLAGNKVRRWDAATGKLLRLVWTAPDAVLSSNGRTIIRGEWGGQDITVDDTVSDGAPHTYWVKNLGGKLVALSPDNRTLATGSWQAPEDLKLVDLGADGPPRRVGSMHLSFDVAAFSPDGQTLAVAGPIPAPPDPDEQMGRGLFQRRKEEDQRCLLWDVASGRLRRQFAAGRNSLRGGGLAFSPDGRLLALRDDRGVVRLWEAATGQEVRRWETKGIGALAISPDGRTLAASDWPGGPVAPMGDYGGFGQTVSLWDADTGEKLGWLIGHSPGALAFSPDGGRLASGSDMDGTALVWDVAAVVGRERPPALRLSPAELADLWADLGGTDAPRAYEAVVRLARAPGDATAFLRGRRAARVAGADATRLSRLAAALDDDDFDVRDKARRELTEVADMAAPMLRERLKDERLSAEARLGLQRVLLAMDDRTDSAMLQWLRATDVLERADAPESRRLLEEMAGADGPAAEAARASLMRLGRRRVPDSLPKLPYPCMVR